MQDLAPNRLAQLAARYGEKSFSCTSANVRSTSELRATEAGSAKKYSQCEDNAALHEDCRLTRDDSHVPLEELRSAASEANHVGRTSRMQHVCLA